MKAHEIASMPVSALCMINNVRQLDGSSIKLSLNLLIPFPDHFKFVHYLYLMPQASGAFAPRFVRHK